MYPDNELAELFTDDNFSKIVSLHKRAQIGCQTYKSLFNYFGEDLVSPDDKPQGEANYYNVISCKDKYISDEDVLDMMVLLDEYAAKHHYVPFIEKAREYSNLVFIIETKIPYVNNTYKFHDEVDIKSSLQAICKRVYKVMKVKLDSRVCISIRSYKKKVYFKIHFLDYFMDIHNRVHLVKQASETVNMVNDENGGLFTSIYPIMYNEFYYTSALPMSSAPDHYYWSIYTVFEFRNKYGSISVNESSKSSLTDLCTAVGNTLAILSINPYDTSYKKVLYSAQVERYEFNSSLQSECILLQKYLNEYPRLAFIDLVLRHLPPEYKQLPACTDIIYSLKVEDIEHIHSLAKHHFRIGDEAINKMWFNSHKKSMFGYYANLVLKTQQFKDELEMLNERIIEREFFSSGAISDFTIAMLVNFRFYGKFYSFYGGSKKKPIEYNYMFIDSSDQSDEKMLYKWDTYVEPPLIANYLSENLYRTMDRVMDKLSITGSSHSKDEKLKALGKMKTKFMNSKDGLRSTSKYVGVKKSLHRSFIISPLFAQRIDTDNYVIGVLNGVLDLDLRSDNPVPKLYTGYSPYVVTKHCEAKYIPYEVVKAKGKYLHLIKSIFKDIIPENDARKKILYQLSTGLEGWQKVIVILMLIGWGSNGKSVLLDCILRILGDYGIKLSPNLLTDPRRGGQADPDFMAMKEKRFALIAETNKSDKLVSARLKSATESVKDGRGLFCDNENFESEPTLFLSTNYPLRFEDFDDGTLRRVLVYNHKVRFVYNPDPNNPNEKKIDPEISRMMENQNARNELFSWLVHLRVKFATKYKSDIHKVPSKTIDEYTSDYRCEQDLLTQFIHQRIVIMIGYNQEGKLIPVEGKTQEEVERDIDAEYEESDAHAAFPHTLSMESIIREYRDWSVQYANKNVVEGFNALLNTFKMSSLARYIIGDQDLAHVKGMRVLKLGKVKVKGEMHVQFRR